jgi:hypothetical protein
MLMVSHLRSNHQLTSFFFLFFELFDLSSSLMKNFPLKFSLTVNFLHNLLSVIFHLLSFLFIFDLIEVMVDLPPPSQNASYGSLAKHFEIEKHFVQI